MSTITNPEWKRELYRRLAEIAKQKDPAKRSHEVRLALADIPDKEVKR